MNAWETKRGRLDFNHIDPGSERRILHWDHQWKVASVLTRLARLAAKQPAPPTTNAQQLIEAQQIERICSGASGAWEWDAWLALSSRPRRVLPDSTHSISVLLEQDKAGCLALLEVELVADGAGEIYPDPLSNGFIEFEQETFLRAAGDVWERVKQEVAPKPEQRDRLEAVDARFRLLHIPIAGYRNPHLQAISGRSAQAAFHLCLLQLANAHLGRSEAILLDQSVAVSATVEDGGGLGGVDPLSLDSKLKAAYLTGLALVIVAGQDEKKARDALQAAQVRQASTGYAASLEVVGANMIPEAVSLLRDRAKEKEAVRRYEREQCRWLDILERKAPIEKHYQALPLLREVKREKLPRSDRERQEGEGQQDDSAGFRGLRGAEVQRWEEELRAEQVTYERHSLADVFSKFRQVVKEARSDVPRFIVLGPPGSGKTTLTQYLASVCCQQGNGVVDGLMLCSANEKRVMSWGFVSGCLYR
jgi:hypothetical protein